MVSRFFARASPSPSRAAAPAARGAERRETKKKKKMGVVARNLTEAASEAATALAAFRIVAKKKNAHKEHEAAAEAVLIPFRPFVETRVATAAASAAGDVVCLDPDDVAGTPRQTAAGCPTLPPEAAPSTLPGASRRRAGEVLARALRELDRLHVNASCRVRQRAPAVAAARARLTALRRECRAAFRCVDPAGFDALAAAANAAKTRLPAARDAEHFAAPGPPRTLRELRERCPLMRATGSPHHLCLHLCYYREYDPARQLFVLRTRTAAALGSAARLDGWRAELRVAPLTEHEDDPQKERGEEGPAREEGSAGKKKGEEQVNGRRCKRRRESSRGARVAAPRRSKRLANDDDDDDDVGDEGVEAPRVGDGGVEGDEDGAGGDGCKGNTRRRKKPRKPAGAAAGGWLAGKSLPWRVVFVSPDGVAFGKASEVLDAIGVDCRAVAPAAATAAGGGGFGREGIEDFDWGDGTTSVNARRLGQVAPAARPVSHNVSWPRASHGGGGVRLARPEEHGLDAATDLLRAALWTEEMDLAVSTEPVRCRAEAAANGNPRSPLRLGPDPFASVTAAERETGGEAPDDRGCEARPGVELGCDTTPQTRNGGEGGGVPEPPTITSSNLRQWWSPPRSPFGGAVRRGEKSAECVYGPGKTRTVPAPDLFPYVLSATCAALPLGLLEEILWADEWKLLVACMMLNCTTRLQVDRVLWRLFLLVPSAADVVRLASDDGGGATSDADVEQDPASPEDPVAGERAGGLTRDDTIPAADVAGDDDVARGNRHRRSGLDRIMEIVQPLGLHRKRAKALVRLSEDYLAATSADAPESASTAAVDGLSTSPRPLFRVPAAASREGTAKRAPLKVPVASLHGVGVYAADAHAMFCEGLLGVAPRDHALRWWYAWAVERRDRARTAAAARRQSL